MNKLQKIQARRGKISKERAKKFKRLKNERIVIKKKGQKPIVTNGARMRDQNKVIASFAKRGIKIITKTSKKVAKNLKK